MSNFTVISDEEAILFEKLKSFYKEVSNLTIHHHVLKDHAVVYPSDLGSLLANVDKDWYLKVNN
jgi:hypothetical protein